MKQTTKMRKLFIRNLGNSHPTATCPNCQFILDPAEDQDNYAKTLIGILATPENQQAGANYAEMNKVLPIIEKFEAVQEAIADGEVGSAFVLLTETELTIVKDRVTSQGFRRISRDVFDMVKAITDCEEVTVEPTDG